MIINNLFVYGYLAGSVVSTLACLIISRIQIPKIINKIMEKYL